ncbi:MAG: CapA family protein [Candidatus Limisoma sp.]|nr:CapA family protein [Bacteroidales bacterium]MDY5894455.1 CapA family protein [Candidatus Limisoma sp.]
MTTLFVYLLSLLQFLTSSDDVTLVFAGDAMQHDRQIAAAQKGNTYDYSDCFKYVSDYISAADYAVVNFECTLGGRPYKGYPCFSAPDEYATALKDAGFDLFLHANNHCLDRRDAGLGRTLDMLDSYGIPHIGTYRNTAERERCNSFITNVKGLRIGILNYTYGTNGIEIQRDVRVNYIDKKQIADDVAQLRKKSPDLISVCIHWGNEYQLVENAIQRDLANYLEDLGVDLIIGGHPHVIQPMEIRHSKKWDKDILVVYSLGNFISAMRTGDTRGGALVKVVVERTKSKPQIKSASYKLVYVQTPVDGHNYQLIPTDRTDLLRGENKTHFHTFVNSARKIFNKYNKSVAEDSSVVVVRTPIPLVPANDSLD